MTEAQKRVIRREFKKALFQLFIKDLRLKLRDKTIKKISNLRTKPTSKIFLRICVEFDNEQCLVFSMLENGDLNAPTIYDNKRCILKK